jgi:2',3'-cyclic-nucleotide 2'-phosphodiesterase/3'-nucleotidase
MELRGEEIINALEHSFAAGERGSGGFLQVSGMKITYNPGVSVGSRVKKITVNGSNLDQDKKYSVVTSDFLAAGGDGYTFFKAISQQRVQGQGKELRDVMIDYIKTKGSICPRTEERIKVERP